MGERGGVAGVLELPQHFRVRQDLSRVAARQLEELAQERRLVHPSEQEHVPGDRCLDQGVEDVPPPSVRLAGKGGPTGVPPK